MLDLNRILSLETQKRFSIPSFDRLNSRRPAFTLSLSLAIAISSLSTTETKRFTRISI
jgi:hypothetical protein